MISTCSVLRKYQCIAAQILLTLNVSEPIVIKFKLIYITWFNASEIDG